MYSSRKKPPTEFQFVYVVTAEWFNNCKDDVNSRVLKVTIQQMYRNVIRL